MVQTTMSLMYEPASEPLELCPGAVVGDSVLCRTLLLMNLVWSEGSDATPDPEPLPVFGHNQVYL